VNHVALLVEAGGSASIVGSPRIVESKAHMVEKACHGRIVRIRDADIAAAQHVTHCARFGQFTAQINVRFQRRQCYFRAFGGIVHPKSPCDRGKPVPRSLQENSDPPPGCRRVIVGGRPALADHALMHIVAPFDPQIGRRYAQQIQTPSEACAVRECQFRARARQIIAEDEAQRTHRHPRRITAGAGDLDLQRRIAVESQHQGCAAAGDSVK